MRLRSRSFLRGTTVALALTLAATISLAGQAQAPAKPATAKAAPASAAAGKAYKAPRTPDGQPDLQGFWTNSTYVPLERPNGVTKEIYTPDEAEAAIKAAAAPRSGADRAGDDRRRALRLQPVRTGSKPVHVREEPADVADRGSAGRQDSAGHRRRAEARAGSRRRAEGGGRSVRRGGEHADRFALHHHGRSRPPAAERRLQRELPDRPGRRAT